MTGIRQVRGYTCGYAVALMVLRHFGYSAPGAEVFAQLGTGRDGTRQTAIIQQLRQCGIAANVRYDLDFARLCRAIDAGSPIVAYRAPIEHWVLIYGYGRDPERILVADPRPGEPNQYSWCDLEVELRGFGVICSSRQRRPEPPGARTLAPEQLSFEFSS